ncbi:dihydrofolate reductase family protein [Nakamurella sp.]|uniref:dihydrofolate reductase family protein n=1 Tax=Nakamurella sp. TaxID=1869182 RepID=UPI003B3A8FE6
MKLSLNTFVSLDGVMQGPGGPDEDTSGGFTRGGWVIPHVDEDFGRIVDEEWFAHADAVLLGRSTFEMMRTYWSAYPNQDELVAKVLNAYPKYLVSTALTDEQAAWGPTTVLRDDVVEQVRALKERPGRELQVHGSWQLAQTLHNAGLVDVYRLLVFPVVVGAGKRLFDDTTRPSAFRTVARTSTAAGATHLVLEPADFTRGDLGIVDGEAVISEVPV